VSSILSGGRRRTAWQPLAEVDWSRGMIRDAPRDAIGKSGVYDSADFLLHQQGFAFKRGGTAYAGPALAGASYVTTVVYAQFPPGAKLVAVGNDSHLYTVDPGSTVDVTGTIGANVRDNPKLRIGGGKNLLIFPNADGVTGPTKYDGSANSTLLAGSPSPGRYTAIYKTRLVLGNSSSNPNRLYFSPTPDIEATWDTANSWIDCDYMVTGLAALHNTLLIFSLGNTERIIGSTPPPGSDMDRAPVGSVGCTDARSIVVQEGSAIFANPRGVYMTNGAGFASLTTDGLIESYWQTLLAGYDRSTWIISGGIYRSFYIVSITNGAGANVATLVCNIPKRAWWRLTNLNAVMWGNAVVAQEELYYADRSSNRVVAISGMFTPTAANKLDANGTPVQPLLEMRMIGEGTGLKAYGDAHLTYDMRDAATDSPALAVSAAPGVEALNFAAVSESPLLAVPNATRRRLTVSKDTQGLSLRFAQSGPSAKTELYAVEQLFRPYTLESQGQ
jgi:hypothetical protein